MNSRIKRVRKSLNLSQEEFGSKMGITGSGVSNLESGRRGITDQMILAICRAFNVDETWLRTGNGDMFAYSDENIVERLAAEMGLDDFAVRALQAYQKLTPANRAVIKQYVLSIAETYGIDIEPEQPDEETRTVYRAASSESRKEGGYMEVPKSLIEKLENAPEADKL